MTDFCHVLPCSLFELFNGSNMFALFPRSFRVPLCLSQVVRSLLSEAQEMAHNAHISQDFISSVIAGEAFANFSLLAFRDNTDLFFLCILYCPLAILFSTCYIVLALFMSTCYKFLVPLFLFPRVAFSRGTNVPSRIDFAIPWALPILFSVLVFQDAFS